VLVPPASSVVAVSVAASPLPPPSVCAISSSRLCANVGVLMLRPARATNEAMASRKELELCMGNPPEVGRR
jgi:hypothetical protein